MPMPAVVVRIPACYGPPVSTSEREGATMGHPNLPMCLRRRSVPITRPLGCRGQLPNTPGPWSPRLVHPMAPYLLRGPCPLGLLDIMLTGDRPGIVTDFVTSTCPGWGCHTARKCQSSSATDHWEPTVPRSLRAASQWQTLVQQDPLAVKTPQRRATSCHWSARAAPGKRRADPVDLPCPTGPLPPRAEVM